MQARGSVQGRQASFHQPAPRSPRWWWLLVTRGLGTTRGTVAVRWFLCHPAPTAALAMQVYRSEDSGTVPNECSWFLGKEAE